jgi:hypothetical protein
VPPSVPSLPVPQVCPRRGSGGRLRWSAACRLPGVNSRSTDHRRPATAPLRAITLSSSRLDSPPTGVHALTAAGCRRAHRGVVTAFVKARRHAGGVSCRLERCHIHVRAVSWAASRC